MDGVGKKLNWFELEGVTWYLDTEAREQQLRVITIEFAELGHLEIRLLYTHQNTISGTMSTKYI